MAHQTSNNTRNQQKNAVFQRHGLISDQLTGYYEMQEMGAAQSVNPWGNKWGLSTGKRAKI